MNIWLWRNPATDYCGVVAGNKKDIDANIDESIDPHTVEILKLTNKEACCFMMTFELSYFSVNYGTKEKPDTGTDFTQKENTGIEFGETLRNLFDGDRKKILKRWKPMYAKGEPDLIDKVYMEHGK